MSSENENLNKERPSSPYSDLTFSEVSSFTLRNKAKMRFLIVAYTLCNNATKIHKKIKNGKWENF